MTGSLSVPVNDFGRLPTQPASPSFHTGVSVHALRFTPEGWLALLRVARPKVRPTSLIIRNGSAHVAGSGHFAFDWQTMRCCSGLPTTPTKTVADFRSPANPTSFTVINPAASGWISRRRTSPI